MPLYRWEIIRRKKPLIGPQIHDVSQVLYLPFDKDHEPYSVESHNPTQVLRLPFEDPPQEITYDRSGYGNDGTIYGAARVIGRGRNALKFDGVDDYVEVSHSASLNATSAVTVGSWIKWISGTGAILSKGDYPNENYYFLVLSDGTLLLMGKIGVYRTDLAASAAGEIPSDVWVHVVGKYDGSKGYLYKDGKLIKEQTPVRTGDLTTNTQALCIGRRGATGVYFNGIIDEVRIYNRALSQPEIKRLMYLRGV